MKKRYEIKIYGDVQGVFFRHDTQKKAFELGLTGWVKNEHDGSVLIIAEGEEKNLDKLVQWSHGGSSSAAVDNAKVEKEEYKGEFEDFGVRY